MLFGFARTAPVHAGPIVISNPTPKKTVLGTGVRPRYVDPAVTAPVSDRGGFGDVGACESTLWRATTMNDRTGVDGRWRVRIGRSQAKCEAIRLLPGTDEYSIHRLSMDACNVDVERREYVGTGYRDGR